MSPQGTLVPDLEGLEAQFNRLEGQHRDTFTHAMSNVFSSEAAELAYAQIVDGLPLSGVERDTYYGSVCYEHPLHTNHMELCPGVLERTQQFLATFDANTLQIDSRLIYAYQAAPPGSRAFRTRLIELVAVAVHQTAVHLFKLDTGLHKDDGLASWAPPKKDTLFWEFFPTGPPPTYFRHQWYCDYDQYPDGVADGVGYWAEARILGGVVLFDRREPGSAPDIESNAVYFHSDSSKSTYRIYRLLDSQKRQLLNFLFSNALLPSSPLPILGNQNNLQRIDPEEPIETTGIYRDRWERKPLSPDAGDDRLRDVIDGLDYPTDEDWASSRTRALERREAMYH